MRVLGGVGGPQSLRTSAPKTVAGSAHFLPPLHAATALRSGSRRGPRAWARSAASAALLCLSTTSATPQRSLPLPANNSALVMLPPRLLPRHSLGPASSAKPTWQRALAPSFGSSPRRLRDRKGLLGTRGPSCSWAANGLSPQGLERCRAAADRSGRQRPLPWALLPRPPLPARRCRHEAQAPPYPRSERSEPGPPPGAVADFAPR
mmetsp:Transcript_110301/g.235593  ORF Transcript_110301/g.235593 Transcript_110301/m.235593 type:complete len:206 (+) Transcript_110301:398-1015(+)